jgi:hypothetical protein
MGVARVNRVLAVSRAFGNRTLRSVIRPDAEVMQRDLTKGDEYLVMASDGLWDVLKNKDVADMCAAYNRMHNSAQKLADELVRAALARGSMDNVTCIVVRLVEYVNRMGCSASSKMFESVQGQPFSTTQQSGSSSIASSTVGICVPLRDVSDKQRSRGDSSAFRSYRTQGQQYQSLLSQQQQQQQQQIQQYQATTAEQYLENIASSGQRRVGTTASILSNSLYNDDDEETVVGRQQQQNHNSLNNSPVVAMLGSTLNRQFSQSLGNLPNTWRKDSPLTGSEEIDNNAELQVSFPMMSSNASPSTRGLRPASKQGVATTATTTTSSSRLPLAALGSSVENFEAHSKSYLRPG